MLTFTFTGVDGTMTESETLTSGMVGKEIRLIFDESWDNLSKTLVFRAGDLNRVVTDFTGDTAVIPEAVLARPFGRLFVGVYGTDAAGTIVIPTVMAEGPMIRYGADPMEDETAEELPVWQNLQNQIGDLSGLNTDARSDLVSAINELHTEKDGLGEDISELEQDLNSVKAFAGTGADLRTAAKNSLVAAVNELDEKHDTLSGSVDALTEAQLHMGEPELLETEHKDTLVGAVNELHGQVKDLSEFVGLTPEAAQLLVDILSQANFASDQAQQIAALANALGAEAPEAAPELIYHWDFRTGSFIDQVAGVEATVSGTVTADSTGAHIDVKNSYIMLPAGPDGATLSGKIMEVKFGQMTLDTSASVLRLVLSSAGTQPATVGVQWNNKGCWAGSSSAVTELTDRQMFSGKTLIAKGVPDSNQIDWYLDGVLLFSTNPTFVPSHISLGSSMSGAFPMVVEYVKIYPAA